MFYPVDWLFGDWRCDIWTRCRLLLLGSRSCQAVLAIAKAIAPKLRDKLEKLRGAWAGMHNYFGVTKSNNQSYHYFSVSLVAFAANLVLSSALEPDTFFG